MIGQGVLILDRISASFEARVFAVVHARLAQGLSGLSLLCGTHGVTLCAPSHGAASSPCHPL